MRSGHAGGLGGGLAGFLAGAISWGARGSQISTPVPSPTFRSMWIVAARLASEAVDHRKAKAGTFADVLGGEEGLGDLLDDVGRNAAARILTAARHSRRGGKSSGCPPRPGDFAR